MQIRNGTVDVTNGSSTVIGNDTTWLSDVEPGGLFGIVRDQALQEILLYEVVDVVSDTELTLSVPYAGESAESVQYTIDQDFTKDGFVLMQNGDRNTAAIYSRTVKKIQERFDNIPAMGDINELLELAEGYIEGAEQAQQASEQARDESVTAKEDSEQARDDALLYRQGAEQAEANAELHAQDANQAKVAAEDSQQAAAAHEQGASAARIAAEQAQQASEDARDISIQKADESAQSATSAEQSEQSAQAIETNVTNLHGEVETNTLTVSNLAVQVANDQSQVASDKQDVRDDRDEVRGLKTETQIFRNQSEQFKNDAEAAAASAAGGLLPVGGWDASTGNLPPAPSDNTQPWYRITEGGTLPGIGEVGVGDNIYWSSTFEDWFHIDNTERFTSINGYTGGTVELDTGDIPENGPQFHTQARVRGSTLAGLSEESTSKPTASDTILSSLGKIISKLWGLAVGDISGLQNALDSKLNSNHPSVTNSREWSASTVPQSEAEGGEATTRRAWTSQRVRQAIVAWWNGVTSSWGRSFVASTDAQAGRSALGLGSMATRDTGTGGSQHRTNSQNDGRFAQLNQSNTYTGMQSFRRTGTVMAFSGDLSGTRIDLHRERVEEIPESTYEDLGFVPNSDLLLRYRLGFSNAPEENLAGVVFSRYDTSNVLAIGMRNTGAGGGVAAGNPDGGLKGIGSINAETIYSNGTEVFEDESGVYTAGSGALSNAVSNMLSANTNDQIRTAIGAGTGDGNAVIGTGSSQVRTNSQLDSRYSQTDTKYSAGTGLSLSGTTFNVSNPFDPSGNYANLRARGTTAADVGVRTNSENDGRYLRDFGSVSGGAYDDYGSDKAGFFYHSQGERPTDSPVNSQASVLALPNTWANCYLVIPNSSNQSMHYRGGNYQSRQVWDNNNLRFEWNSSTRTLNIVTS